MSELVGNGEGCTEAVVLDHRAAVLAAHRAELSKAESVTVLLWNEGH